MENLNCIDAWEIILAVAVFLAIVLMAVVLIWLQVKESKRKELLNNAEVENLKQRTVALKIENDVRAPKLPFKV